MNPYEIHMHFVDRIYRRIFFSELILMRHNLLYDVIHKEAWIFMKADTSTLSKGIKAIEWEQLNEPDQNYTDKLQALEI